MSSGSALHQSGRQTADQIWNKLPTSLTKLAQLVAGRHTEHFAGRLATHGSCSVCRIGKHFSKFKTAFCLHDNLITEAAVNTVDRSKTSDPAERSIPDQKPLDAIIGRCSLHRSPLRQRVTIKFEPSINFPYAQRRH